MIASAEELRVRLSAMQEARQTEGRWELSPALSARMTHAALTALLLSGLPMAQELRPRIVRTRASVTLLTVKLRYRMGLRLTEGSIRTPDEAETLRRAQEIADSRPAGDASAAFDHVYGWLCRFVRYAHTAPGQKGYERLVCAAGALLDGQANCQGFADALYLLCSLCGIRCEYRVGRGERRWHVWNAVFLDGRWQEADASRGARGTEGQPIDNFATKFRPSQKPPTQEGENVLY